MLFLFLLLTFNRSHVRIYSSYKKRIPTAPRTKVLFVVVVVVVVFPAPLFSNTVVVIIIVALPNTFVVVHVLVCLSLSSSSFASSVASTKS